MADPIDQLYSSEWYDNILKTIDLLGKQEGAIKANNDAMRSLVSDLKGAKSLEDLATGQTKVAAATQQAVAGFDDFNTAIKQAEALKAQYNGSTKEIVAITLTSAKATKELANAARIQQANVAKSISSAAAEKKAIKDLTDERALLVKALKDEEVRYANLFITQGKANKQTEEAKNRVLQLRATLDSINQPIGRFGDNVGNYAGKFNSLGFAIRNIAGELPNLGISVRTFAQSISNNIGPLSDAIKEARVQNAALAAEGKPTVSIGKQIASSIFNWQTAILAVVAAGTFLVTYLTQSKGAMADSEKANKKYADSLKEIEESSRSSAQAEIAHVNVLTTIAADTTQSMRNRVKAVKELQDTYPARFGALTQEAILEGKVAEALRATTDELLKKAAFQASEEKFAASSRAVYEGTLAQRKALAELAEAEKKEAAQRAYLESQGYTPSKRAGALVERAQANLDAIVKLNNASRKEQQQYLDDAKKFAQQAGDTILGDDPRAPKVAKSKKEKDNTKELEREEERQRKEYFTKLQARAEKEALIKKAAVDDDKKTFAERRAANDDYTFYLILAAQYRGAKEKQTAEEIEKAITEIVLNQAKIREKIDEDESKVKINAKKVALKAIQEAEKENADRAKKLADKEKAKLNADIEYAQYGQNINNSVSNLLSAQSEKRINEINKEIEALEKRRQTEIDGVNGMLISEDKKAAKIAAINARTAAEEEKRNEKIRQEKRRDAQRNKLLQISQMIINGAAAVVSLLATPPLAIAAGITAAAEIATAIATPIPEFRKGGTVEKDTFARVSEEGRELAITKEGKAYLTPDKDTITYLQAGTKIIPHTETMEIMKYMAVGLPQLRSNGKDYPMDEIMGETAEKIVNAIRSKKFTATSQASGWNNIYYTNRNK